MTKHIVGEEREYQDTGKIRHVDVSHKDQSQAVWASCCCVSDEYTYTYDEYT